MPYINPDSQSNWLLLLEESIRDIGYVVVENVLNPQFIAESRDALYQVEQRIIEDVGEKRIIAAREAGDIELRLIMKYHDHFLRFFEIPRLTSVVEALLGDFAILRFQNGFIHRPNPGYTVGRLPQNRFHMNSRRSIPGFMGWLEIAFPIQHPENKQISSIVPGSHQKATTPTVEYLESAEKPILCPVGAMLVFDGTLWHREAPVEDEDDLLSVTFQFTRHFFKPHFDFARALGEDIIRNLPAKTQQYLGWNARVPASLQEFYVPPEKRFYKGDQD